MCKKKKIIQYNHVIKSKPDLAGVMIDSWVSNTYYNRMDILFYFTKSGNFCTEKYIEVYLLEKNIRLTTDYSGKY